jgi:hypothetical protein
MLILAQTALYKGRVGLCYTNFEDFKERWAYVAADRTRILRGLKLCRSSRQFGGGVAGPIRGRDRNAHSDTLGWRKV